MLGDDLTAALAALGLAPLGAEAITGLPTADDRLTLRVALAGGGAVKLRRCRWEQQARQYQTLTAGVGDVALSRVLGRVGRVCVEEWIPGTSLAQLPLTAARVAAAAELLGRLHRERRRASVAPFVRRLRGQLARLAAAGRIERRLAARVADRLVRGAPRRAAWGLIHFDLCAENLVEDPAGRLVAVDNERLQPGFLDFDLARTWYRWPLPEPEWTRFVAAYTRWRAPPDDTAGFWRLAALAGSAVLRLRGGADAAEPLRRLAAQR